MDISSDYCTRESVEMATNEDIKGETKSLLIAAQNKAIRTNYIETNIDNIQKYWKFNLCGNKNEKV